MCTVTLPKHFAFSRIMSQNPLLSLETESCFTQSLGNTDLECTGTIMNLFIMSATFRGF